MSATLIDGIDSVVDEFADLEDVGSDSQDNQNKKMEAMYNNHIASVTEMLNHKTLNGLDTNSLEKIISTNSTDSMEFNHVSLKMNTNSLHYLGGALVRDFNIFNFVSEVFPGDEPNQISILENIIIPSSVRVIHSEAFYNYHFLKSIIFEDNSSLEYLGSGAFAYCPRLLKLDLSTCESLEVLHAQTFACSGIKLVSLPNKLRYINEKAFDDSEVKYVVVGKVKYKLSDFISILKSNNYTNFWDFETMVLMK